MLESGPGLRDVGRIQPAGCLLVLDAGTERVVASSENLDLRVPGWTVDKAVGSAADAILGRKVLHDVRNASALPSFSHQPEPMGIANFGAEDVEASVYGVENSIVIEFCDAQEMPSALTLVRDLAHVEDRLRGSGDLLGALERLSGLIRIMSGYDNVQTLLIGQDGTARILAAAGQLAEGISVGSVVPSPWTEGASRPAHQRFLADALCQPVPVLARGLDRLDLALAATAMPSEERLTDHVAQGLRSEMILPVYIGTRLWGGLVFQSRRVRQPSLRFKYFCHAVSPLLTELVQRGDAQG